jgi:ankyrin repeat protein
MPTMTIERMERYRCPWAAEEGHEAVVWLLLEYKAKVDARDSSGRTPLPPR